MQAQDIPGAVTYGPYSLVVSLLRGGGMLIVRQDADHKRTVATVASLNEWDYFVAALKAGADEVAAVHAIDDAVADELRRTAYDAWKGGGGHGRPDLDDLALRAAAQHAQVVGDQAAERAIDSLLDVREARR